MRRNEKAKQLAMRACWNSNKCKHNGKKESTHDELLILPLLLLSEPQKKPIEASTNLRKEAGV
jgi:hypothetical protein